MGNMQALHYKTSPVGWLTCKWLRHLWRGCLASGLGGISLRQTPAPELPGDDWVLVRTLLGGLCGTDLAILAQKQRPDSILQAFSSTPMILGHENVGVVEAVGPAVDASWKGKRVCVEPTLNCVPRGIEPMCEPCRRGQFGACENFGAAGAGPYGLPAGTSIGYNARTGGSWGEFFVAHVSQLIEPPAGLSDEQAVLTDPVACSLHAVLRAEANLSAAKRVLVYGPGMLGLAAIACLRAIGYAGIIDVVGRHGYLNELARKMGATEVLSLGRRQRERFDAIAARCGGAVHRVRFGNLMLSGGYDVTFDCVGSPQSIEECLKWTAARGLVVLVGTGDGRGSDMTSIWFRELAVIGAYGRGLETLGGKRTETYRMVHQMMLDGRIDVRSLLTHTFRLNDYRRAIMMGLGKAEARAVKIAFDFR